MAKDRRNRSKSPQQVNLAQKASGQGGTSSPQASKTTKSKKRKRSRTVLLVLLVVLIAVSLVFVIVMGKMVYDSLVTPKKKNTATLSSYVTTPEADQDKVAYYLVGMFGEDRTKSMDMLSIVCFDKKAKTVNILDLPQDTYVGEDGDWAVKRVADVWANPKPLDWCESCRKQVFAPEIKDGRHNIPDCGRPITQKTGSASEGLIQLVNKQYGLPVDAFFLMERESFVKLVNLMGGVDVLLEEAMTLGEIKYKAGVQTLTGEAALQYCNTFKAGADGDVGRIVKRRKVMAALLDRMCDEYDGYDQFSKDKLNKAVAADKILDALMKGSTPIRTNAQTGEMMQILGMMRDVSFESITAYVLPGGAAKSGGVTYFSPNKAELLTLLNENFNPYGREILEGDLQLATQSGAKKSDLHKQTFAEVMADQSGEVTATTTAA